MQRNEQGLAALASIAPTTGQVINGVHGGLKELFHTVSVMEEGHQQLPVDDTLIRPVYHALLISYLSKRAVYAATTDQSAPDEATRKADLREILQAHTVRCTPLPYIIVGLCYAPYCPATLVRLGATLFVACRSTQTPGEFGGDLKWPLRRVSGVLGMRSLGHVHTGFLNAFRGQAEEVLARIDALVRAGWVEDVVFCGHSLGGAVAQLLGVIYSQRRGQSFRSLVVSFGCPRIGDTAFRYTLGRHIDHTRLYARKDPIPALFSGYAPHGGMKADGEGSWRLEQLCQAVARAPEAPTRLLRSLRPWRPHQLTTYAAALDDHRSKRKGMAADGPLEEAAAV